MATQENNSFHIEIETWDDDETYESRVVEDAFFSTFDDAIFAARWMRLEDNEVAVVMEDTPKSYEPVARVYPDGSERMYCEPNE